MIRWTFVVTVFLTGLAYAQSGEKESRLTNSEFTVSHRAQDEADEKNYYLVRAQDDPASQQSAREIALRLARANVVRFAVGRIEINEKFVEVEMPNQPAQFRSAIFWYEQSESTPDTIRSLIRLEAEFSERTAQEIQGPETPRIAYLTQRYKAIRALYNYIGDQEGANRVKTLIESLLRNKSSPDKPTFKVTLPLSSGNLFLLPCHLFNYGPFKIFTSKKRF